MLGAPELDAGLQVGSHESGVKGQNPLPRPAGHAALDTARDTVGFLGCKRTLLARVELLIHHPFFAKQRYSFFNYRHTNTMSKLGWKKTIAGITAMLKPVQISLHTNASLQKQASNCQIWKSFNTDRGSSQG